MEWVCVAVSLTTPLWLPVGCMLLARSYLDSRMEDTEDSRRTRATERNPTWKKQKGKKEQNKSRVGFKTLLPTRQAQTKGKQITVNTSFIYQKYHLFYIKFLNTLHIYYNSEVYCGILQTSDTSKHVLSYT